jgi:DNA anti-recombination protein RmuC
MYDQIVSERDTLRDHIKMLISDIEKRVETEKRLHAVNVQLRDRLEGLHGEVDEGVHTNAQHKEIRRLTQALVRLPSSPVLTDLLQACRSTGLVPAFMLCVLCLLVYL